MTGEAMPTGREKPGEHWNARIIREEAEAGPVALVVDSIDVTPLAVAICHRLHLMNHDPLPCRACITKVTKALPVLSALLSEARSQTAEQIAQAIEARLAVAKAAHYRAALTSAAGIAREVRSRG